MGLELFALGLVASQLAVYGLVIGEFANHKYPFMLLTLPFSLGGGGVKQQALFQNWGFDCKNLLPHAFMLRQANL